MKEEEVILVDENDNPVGLMFKLEAHQKGLLHRAFSIFIYNENREMLLQKRATGKYHSPGLWTNACCSHPRADESIEAALQRKLQQEMGFTCDLRKIFHLTYKAEFGNGLIEHEFDHVYIGEFNGEINPNPEEVSEYAFFNSADVKKGLINDPAKFTEWFKLIYPKTLKFII